MRIKAIIADDEEQLRISIRTLLAEIWPELDVCGEAGNGKAAFELVEKHQPQVAFLDIRMPGLSGMEVATKIAGSCRVVFMTAYDQYAVEAFENEAMDYLLKPVGRDRLAQTVARLKKELSGSAPTAEMVEMTRRLIERLDQGGRKEHLNWIKAQQGGVVRLIPVTDIVYFKASDKYTLVITADKEFLIRKTIKELAGVLDPLSFWQIHRGIIVNVSCIAAVSRSITGRGVLRIKGRSETLTISRRYLPRFKQM